jgi:peptidyl-prolyl cis-trans isomerase A (cyclophilin A)
MRKKSVANSIRNLSLPMVMAVMILIVATPQAQSQAQTPPSQPPAQTQSQPATTTTTPAASLPDFPDAPSTTANVQPRLQPTGPTAIIDTTMGRISCKLFSKEAPVTVDNFITLAEGTREWTDPATRQKIRGRKFYNGLTFHRVIPEFMIQGGDPVGDGTGDAGYFFNDEINPNLNFDVAGRLAMANAGPNTNGTQFFITEAPAPSLDQHYNIFGQCDDVSVATVKAIARVPRNPANDKPYEPVVIRSITIVREGQPVPADPATTQQTAPANSQPISGAQKPLTPQR